MMGTEHRSLQVETDSEGVEDILIREIPCIREENREWPMTVMMDVDKCG